MSPWPIIAQGITDDTIKIGCTYSVSGALAIVGVPMLDTVRGVFNRVNENGGIGGRKLELVYLDDGGDAANARALTERLTEEEKVFAITAMPGNAVNTTIDYVYEMGIPVVDLVTGLDIAYSENDPGGNVFPVQPSWGQDGSFIAARVFHSSVYGPNKDQPLPADAKVGVVYANNDQGSCLYNGFMKQVKTEGFEDRVVTVGFPAGEYSAAVQTLKDEGCSVAVMLMGVAQIKGAVAAMDDIQYEVPVFTFYGNSSVVPGPRRSTRKPVLTSPPAGPITPRRRLWPLWKISITSSLTATWTRPPRRPITTTPTLRSAISPPTSWSAACSAWRIPAWITAGRTSSPVWRTASSS